MIAVRSSSVALWNGILTGPIAFAIVFELKYALIDYVCRNHAHWLFWIFFLGGLALCAFGAFTAWAGVRRDDGDLGAPAARAHFMGLAGIGLSISFAIFIVALMIPDLYLRPCE